MVTGLIDRFGFDIIDLGALSEGWRIQRDTPGYAVRLHRSALEQASAERYRDV